MKERPTRPLRHTNRKALPTHRCETESLVSKAAAIADQTLDTIRWAWSIGVRAVQAQGSLRRRHRRLSECSVHGRAHCARSSARRLQGTRCRSGTQTQSWTIYPWVEVLSSFIWDDLQGALRQEQQQPCWKTHRQGSQRQQIVYHRLRCVVRQKGVLRTG